MQPTNDCTTENLGEQTLDRHRYGVECYSDPPVATVGDWSMNVLCDLGTCNRLGSLYEYQRLPGCSADFVNLMARCRGN